MVIIPQENILIRVITNTELLLVEYCQVERIKHGMGALMQMETHTKTTLTRARINSETHGSTEWVVQTATKMESLMATTHIQKMPHPLLMTTMETV